MVLGDVIEVVGDRAADIQLGVVSQSLQDGKDGIGLVDKKVKAGAPRQPRTNPLRAPAPYVGARVVGPSEQFLKRLLWVTGDKGADGKLRGESLCELVHAGHGGIELVGTIVSNKLTDWPLDEAVGDFFAIGQYRGKAFGQNG